MNVDLGTRRSALFSESVREKLARVGEVQKDLERPSRFGRTLSIRRE